MFLLMYLIFNSFTAARTQKQGIIAIDNAEILCVPRAIVVAIAHTVKDPDYRKILKNTQNMQTVNTVGLGEIWYTNSSK